MRPHVYLAMAMTAAVLAPGPVRAATDKVYARHGYTLKFTDLSKTADQKVVDQLVDTFYVVYPKLAHDFNPQASHTVAFVIDPAYDGVAATDSARTVFNPQWFVKHPADTDVVTHEVMHIVQDYRQNEAPGWLVEGIADYVRYRYGLANAAAGWQLPGYKPTQGYESSYRVTARFFAWLEIHGHEGIVKRLDSQLRAGTYTSGSWTVLAGKDVDALWADYAASPAL
jgi:basic secretory peptidase family protein